MGVSFERVTGWLARIGEEHRRYGDPYTATALVTDNGTVKGFAGRAAPRLIREVIGAAERHIGKPLTWERIRTMADKYEAKIVMEYREVDSANVKARATIEYFDMEQKHIDAVEGAVLGGLLGLREGS